MTTGRSAPPTVPATAFSRFESSYQRAPALVIGTNAILPPQSPDAFYYWYVVISLKDLSVAANVVNDNQTSVPPQIAAFANKPDYFLFVIANRPYGYNVPRGELYSFLRATGAGNGLAALEQMITQLGTGIISAFSYVLAATTLQQDVPGFEAWSYTDISVLTIQFIPVEVSGQWIYAPAWAGSTRAAGANQPQAPEGGSRE